MEPVLSIASSLARCEYLPDQTSRLRLELFRRLDADSYFPRLEQGWRRFGPVLFRPECPSCRRCESLRVPTDTFRPNESQRRAWKRNIDTLTVRIGAPHSTPDKLDLFARFHQHKHDVQGWPYGEEQKLDTFLNNPFPTEEWTYALDDRLLAVGYVDVLREGLSAIYFFWDPAEHRRSLGTFNILAMIASARRRGLPHVYLGYCVEGCRSLEYKARFRPNEVLRPDGWTAFCT
jgi:arginine-tRNA-protein transferase